MSAQRRGAGRRPMAGPVVLAVAATTALAAGCGSRGAGNAAAVATTARPPAPATTRTAPRTTTTTRPAPPATTTTSRPAPPAPPSTLACAPALPATLATTGGARQLITVAAPTSASTTATVEAWERQGSCWVDAGGPWAGYVGANGFSDHKREGDNTTPTGLYPISPIVYGNQPNPGVQGSYHQLVCGDWWDEDPTSPAYNTFQHVSCGTKPPFGGGSEALWTETAPYPSFAVVDYNTGPVVPHAGSAVFLHAATGGPTAGCVSIPLADLDQVLRWLAPAEQPAIVMGPAAEISRF